MLGSCLVSILLSTRNQFKKISLFFLKKRERPVVINMQLSSFFCVVTSKENSNNKFYMRALTWMDRLKKEKTS